jgi:uncharacterized protein
MERRDEERGPGGLADVDVVARAIQAVSDLDAAEARRWVADDLVLELPFRPRGFPRTLVGPDAHSFIRAMDRIFERMDFHDVVIHGPTPSGVIAAEYKSNGITKAGRPYLNAYAAFFEVADGRVARWREYFNPDVVAEALG